MMEHTRKELARIFQDTRRHSQETFAGETEKACGQVRVYTECPDLPASHTQLCPIRFVEEDTISAARQAIAQGHRVCMLNFADSLEPGGLVLYGEVTQEEDICRCTNLYETLLQPECQKNYYEYNRLLGTHTYSDRLIYSRDCLIFKDSQDYQLLEEPVSCDVITSPAPVAGFVAEQSYYDVVRNRIRWIIQAARDNQADVLILGAWGCGAFGGDALEVGKAFGEVLREYPDFHEVVFAVKTHYQGGYHRQNFEKLQKGFQSSFYS